MITPLETGALLLFWLLAGLVSLNVILVVRVFWALWRRPRPLLPDGACPKTAVILSLRGPDPFLPAAIDALMKQDFPDYDVYIVVDDRDDPAWQVAEEAAARANGVPVTLEPLTERLGTCSLKCASMLQAIGKLKETHEVVALMDSDIIPHRTWLRELVAPLADERVAAATGNRWYMPAQTTWGAIVRYLWNVMAVVQMYWYGIPWGGCLAVKTKIFRHTDLLRRWANTLSEDQSLAGLLRQLGLKIAFVPTLMMVSRETVDLPGYFDWMRRQLMVARLYNPRWLLVIGHAFVTLLIPFLAIGFLGWACFAGSVLAAAWTGAGLALYGIAMLVALVFMESAVRRRVRTRAEPTSWVGAHAVALMVPAFFLTHFLYAVCFFTMRGLRLFVWRRVVYRIDGPWDIRVLEDRPYRKNMRIKDPLASI